MIFPYFLLENTVLNNNCRSGKLPISPCVENDKLPVMNIFPLYSSISLLHFPMYSIIQTFLLPLLNTQV